MFQPGAMLRPARNATFVFVELTFYIEAGSYQIFDLSLGRLVSLAQRNIVCPAIGGAQKRSTAHKMFGLEISRNMGFCWTTATVALRNLLSGKPRFILPLIRQHRPLSGGGVANFRV
jgi:hypothetical protein